jgi:hypothetical protein
MSPTTRNSRNKAGVISWNSKFVFFFLGLPRTYKCGWRCESAYMAYQGFHLRGQVVECCLMCVYMRSQINRDSVINDGKLLLYPSEVWGVVLRPLACWDCGFESHRGYGRLSCECCFLSGRDVCAPLSLSRGVLLNVVCLGYLGRSLGHTSLSRDVPHVESMNCRDFGLLINLVLWISVY